MKYFPKWTTRLSLWFPIVYTLLFIFIKKFGDPWLGASLLFVLGAPSLFFSAVAPLGLTELIDSQFGLGIEGIVIVDIICYFSLGLLIGLFFDIGAWLSNRKKHKAGRS